MPTGLQRGPVLAAPTGLHPRAADSLALAVIASSNAPLVLLDDALNLIAASDTFYRAFQIDPANGPGRPVFELGSGEWDVPQLRSLLWDTTTGHAEIDTCEMDLDREGQASRRLVLNAQKLDCGDADHNGLLLAVSDVTDARLSVKVKDDLLREKTILLKESRHRIANSLEVIASILLQSARRMNSDEARRHLHDAHDRVMSVAAVQRQLAATTLGDVALRPYFTELCQSIGASMIRDNVQLTLTVEADETLCSAEVSVSLGLIVTELVINTLKHAFPGGRYGRIMVEYHVNGPAWTLSVADNGVGMPADPASVMPGLGTSIVEALAKQLQASVQVADAHPGTRVSIVHA